MFVDGRVEAYPIPLLERSRQADLFGDYRGVFDDYGIRCAVVSTGDISSLTFVWILPEQFARRALPQSRSVRHSRPNQTGPS